MESYVFEWQPADFQALVESCDVDPIIPYVAEYLPKHGKIVEAGCGLGRLLVYLGARGYDIEGIEASQRTVEQVKQFRPDLHIKQGDVAHLPYANDSLAGMISIGVIEHFPAGPEAPLRDAYRSLRPGAFALITVPAVNHVRRVKYATGYYRLRHQLRHSTLLRRALGKAALPPDKELEPVGFRFRRWPTVGDFYEYRFTKAEFESHLRNAGFEIVESVPIHQMDGLFHDFGRYFTTFKNWKFYPNILGRALNAALSTIPGLHNHMHLCVARKPLPKESSAKDMFQDVLSVNEEGWRAAQKFERGCWERATSTPTWSLAKKTIRSLLTPRLLWRYIKFRDFYIGDAANYWWMQQFDGYAALPPKLDKAIEIGCGPFTNMRLISRITRTAEICCTDPLVSTYLEFRHTWLPAAVRSKRAHAVECMGESLPFPDKAFDLVVCINVLDHVLDAVKCMEEGLRVLAPGGFFVFGQDLTNSEDFARHPMHTGHPVRIQHETLDHFLGLRIKPLFKKLLMREQGRTPDYHYGTYLLIGQKLSAK